MYKQQSKLPTLHNVNNGMRDVYFLYDVSRYLTLWLDVLDERITIFIFFRLKYYERTGCFIAEMHFTERATVDTGVREMSYIPLSFLD